MRLILLMIFLSVTCSLVDAQPSVSVVLEIGSGAGQIGLERSPNVACRGPSAIAATSQDRVAILDAVNHKILVVGRELVEVPLPDDLSDLSDIASTTKGYLVVDERGAIVHVAETGGVLSRTSVPHRADEGALRFTSLRDGRLALEGLSGTRTAVDIGGTGPESLLLPGNVAGGTYEVSKSADGREVFATSARTLGSLSKISARSALRVLEASVAWMEAGRGALLAFQEVQRLPQEASFVRLQEYGAEGRPLGEAYVDAQSYSCEMRRPFVRTEKGRVLTLIPTSSTSMELRQLSFRDRAQLPSAPAGQPGARLISTSDSEILTAMERVNGTTNAAPVSMSQVTRATIIGRARQALTLKWTLAPANYENTKIQNRCSPPADIWTRPHRLEGRKGQEIEAVPYRWGGYVRTLAQFEGELASGKLAGSVCTCRNMNCVNSHATGQDCSGFVSYAWDTGNYYTTASLPKRTVSEPLTWDQVLPGDIVNAAGSHVRLVESIESGPQGRVFVTIESATKRKCGGVCRDSYLQLDLDNAGYKPYRRLALRD